MSLNEFLSRNINYISRESVLYHRIVYDLSLAAGQDNYAIQVYSPEVDREGVDVILADHNLTSRRIQLKGTRLDASTSSWTVHARHIRPTAAFDGALGFNPTHGGRGEGGALIIQEYTVTQDESLNIKYLFCDAAIISLFADNVIERDDSKSDRPPAEQAEEARHELHNATGNQKVKIPKAICLEARSPSALLSLMNLYNSRYSSYIDHVRMYYEHQDNKDMAMRAVVSNLNMMVNDNLVPGASPRTRPPSY